MARGVTRHEPLLYRRRVIACGGGIMGIGEGAPGAKLDVRRLYAPSEAPQLRMNTGERYDNAQELRH